MVKIWLIYGWKEYRPERRDLTAIRELLLRARTRLGVLASDTTDTDLSQVSDCDLALVHGM
jgi:hypothetical protein